jgi:hypothetical protein
VFDVIERPRRRDCVFSHVLCHSVHMIDDEMARLFLRIGGCSSASSSRRLSIIGSPRWPYRTVPRQVPKGGNSIIVLHTVSPALEK